jgi:hypothetical protein
MTEEEKKIAQAFGTVAMFLFETGKAVECMSKALPILKEARIGIEVVSDPYGGVSSMFLRVGEKGLFKLEPWSEEALEAHKRIMKGRFEEVSRIQEFRREGSDIK